jgi:hypothetical protein
MPREPEGIAEELMNKLSAEYQQAFADRNIYDESVIGRIDSEAKLHAETRSNPLSSAASCLNVLGVLSSDPEGVKGYLNALGLGVTKVYDFPSGADVGGQVYNDSGCVVFEWVGPKASPINEKGGGRGLNRTSVDAFIIAEIDGVVTQLLIEWKFTEGKSRPIALNKFGGLRGVERLRRYASVLAEMWGKGFPFAFSEEGGIGLQDFSADHFYQLLRMTLLARKTTPMRIGDLEVEDYRVVHLSHSENDKINLVQPEYAKYCPGVQGMVGKGFHEAWKSILTPEEQKKFVAAHWDSGIKSIKNKDLREYLLERYG